MFSGFEWIFRHVNDMFLEINAIVIYFSLFWTHDFHNSQFKRGLFIFFSDLVPSTSCYLTLSHILETLKFRFGVLEKSEICWDE